MKKAIKELDKHDTTAIYIATIIGPTWKEIEFKDLFLKNMIDKVKKGRQQDGLGYSLKEEEIAFMKKAINHVRINSFLRGVVSGIFNRGLHC